MTEDKKSSFEIDVNEPLHEQAVRYLVTRDKERFPAIGDAIVAAVSYYFGGGHDIEPEKVSRDTFTSVENDYLADLPDDYDAPEEYRTEETFVPLIENGQINQDKLISIIEKAVEKSVDKVLPKYLQVYLKDLVLAQEEDDSYDSMAGTRKLAESEIAAIEQEIDWGFLGD